MWKLVLATVSCFGFGSSVALGSGGTGCAQVHRDAGLRAILNQMKIERTRQSPGPFSDRGFRAGELVSVGVFGDSRLPDSQGGTGSAEAYARSLRFATYLRGLDVDGVPFAEVRYEESGISVQVPLETVQQEGLGRESRLRKLLRVTNSIAPRFAVGEIVRFRLNGFRVAGEMMVEGRVVEKRDGRFLVRFHNRQAWLPARSIFKSLGHRFPHSIWLEKESWSHRGEVIAGTDFEFPRGLQLEFLNAAARFSSHPEFAALSQVEQVQMLSRFATTLLPYNSRGSEFERDGVRSIDQILACGFGVCRHQTQTLAAVLSETGFSIRILALNTIVGTRHTWLEADLGYPRRLTFVIDPSSKVVLNRALIPSHGPAAALYLNPAREEKDIDRSNHFE